MKRNKSSILVSMILILSLFLAACQSGQQAANETSKEPSAAKTKAEDKKEENTPQPGGDLVVGVSGNPTTFNPIYWSDVSPSGAISGLIFNGLVRFDGNLSPEPALAERWETSEDGLSWTFYLRKDVKFSDGDPFTAEDVKFTFDIPLSKDYGGPRASEFGAIKSVDIVDDYTVNFTLKEPKVGFIYTAQYGILPAHILKDVPIKDLGKHEFNTKNPVGTGPFKFVEWKDGQFVKLARNENYFEGAPYLDSMTFKFIQDPNAFIAQLQTGEIQVTGVQPSDFETVEKFQNDGQVSIISFPSFSYSYIGYNLTNPLFQDKKVRQALTMAIDRQGIIDSVLSGRGTIANSSLPPASWAYDDSKIPVYDFDTEKAKTALAEAGWKDTDGDGILDKDGKKFSFELLTGNANKAWADVVVIVQQQLKEVGIEVKPEVMEWSAFVNNHLLAKKFDAVLASFSVGLDPDQSFLFSTDAIKTGYNIVSYSNPEVDSLFKEQLSIMDQEERKVVISKINSIIGEDSPFTFMYYNTNDIAIPANLKGMADKAPSLYYHPEKWYFENK